MIAGTSIRIHELDESDRGPYIVKESIGDTNWIWVGIGPHELILFNDTCQPFIAAMRNFLAQEDEKERQKGGGR